MSRMERNVWVEWLLGQALRELWKMNRSLFDLQHEPMTKFDGKWVMNPKFKEILQEQEDIIWRELSGRSQLGRFNHPKIFKEHF